MARKSSRGMTRSERIHAAATLGEHLEAHNPDAKHALRSRADHQRWRRSSDEIARRAAAQYGLSDPTKGCAVLLVLPGAAVVGLLVTAHEAGWV